MARIPGSPKCALILLVSFPSTQLLWKHHSRAVEKEALQKTQDCFSTGGLDKGKGAQKSSLNTDTNMWKCKSVLIWRCIFLQMTVHCLNASVWSHFRHQDTSCWASRKGCTTYCKKPQVKPWISKTVWACSYWAYIVQKYQDHYCPVINTALQLLYRHVHLNVSTGKCLHMPYR